MDKKEKTAGLVAGTSLIVMTIVAGFSYGFVHNGLVNESADITKQNLIENRSLFLGSLVGWLVIFLTDLIVAGALFVFFKNVMKQISALTSIIRIGYTLILGVAIYQLLGVVPLLESSATPLEIHKHFETFEKIWSAGLIIFGFHLIGIGYLSVRSRYIPDFLAYLLYFAGVCYVLIHSAKLFPLISKNVVDPAETILALPMALSEISLAVLLIYKGLRKVKKG